MTKELWGGETRKAIDNFPVSGERVPAPVVRWLGRIKAAAARTNADLGLLDAGIAERIAVAGDAVAAGEHDDQFPIDVFQTGSGTSSNMNANEVHRRRSPATGATRTTTSTWASPRTTSSPRRSTSPRSSEVTNALLPALDQLACVARGEGRASSTTSSSPGART